MERTSASIAPLVALVRVHHPDLYRCVEVADALNTSPATLRRLARADWKLWGPTRGAPVRGLEVCLYDMDRVESLAYYLETHSRNGTRGGRPQRWGPDERRARRARHS